MLDIYKLALDNENGIYAPTLIDSLNKAREVMWTEAHAVGLGNEYVNTHPVMIVLVDRLYTLAHPARSGIYKDYHAARRVCQDRAGTNYSQGLVDMAQARPSA